MTWTATVDRYLAVEEADDHLLETVIICVRVGKGSVFADEMVGDRHPRGACLISLRLGRKRSRRGK